MTEAECLEMACEFVAYLARGFDEFKTADFFDTTPELVLFSVKKYLNIVEH